MLQTNDRYWIDFVMGLLANQKTRYRAESVFEEMCQRDLFEHIIADPISRTQVAATTKKIIDDTRMSNISRCYAVKLFAKFNDTDPIEVFKQKICAERLTNFSECFVAIAMMEALTLRAQKNDEAAINFIRHIQLHNSEYKIIREAAAKALGEILPD